MGEVYKAIGRVAGQDMPVLITGESGTGGRREVCHFCSVFPSADVPSNRAPPILLHSIPSLLAASRGQTIPTLSWRHESRN
jgi:hypothetical protein